MSAALYSAASLPHAIEAALGSDHAKDIEDACLVNGLTLASIAVEHTEEDLADKLFLTKNESSCFVSVCRSSFIRAGDKEGLELGTPTATESELLPPETCEDPISPAKNRMAPSAAVTQGDILYNVTKSARNQNLPSYMRPTSGYTAKSAKVEAKQSKKHNTQAAYTARSMTLHAPTAATLSRASAAKAGPSSHASSQFTSGQYKMDPNGVLAARSYSMSDARLRCSLQSERGVSAIMNLPQGQRVTRAQPFGLSMDRAKDQMLSSEETELLMAKAHAFKPLPLRRELLAPVEPKVASSPRDPSEIFRPFKLASLERHATFQGKAAEELKRKQDVARREREFKARSFDKSLAEGPRTPHKPDAKPATVPSPTNFKSEQRGKLHKEVLAPAKLAKIAALEMAREDRRKKEQEEEEAAEKLKEQFAEEQRLREEDMENKAVIEHRKTLGFTARQMPSFDSPFMPDLAKSQPVTRGQEFRLKTDQRLGKSISMSSCYKAEGICFDSAGNMILRRSMSTANPLRLSDMGGLSLSALRRSTNCLSMGPSRRTSQASLAASAAVETPRGPAARKAAHSASELRKALEAAMAAVGVTHADL